MSRLKRGVLQLGRRFAAAHKFTDRCRITREGERIWNEETLQYDTNAIVVYEGVCSLLSPYRGPTEGEATGQTRAVELARLSVPVETSVGVNKGDKVTYLESASDPDLPGRVFVVAVGSQQSDSTARRIPVEEFS